MSSNDNEGSVEELLQCSICMNSFQTSGSREPKMLRCQHTFCVACLKRVINDKRIQCPLCRQVSVTTIDQLPRNLLLMQLIDLAGSPAANQTVKNPEQTLKLVYKDPSKALTALKLLNDEVQLSRKYSEGQLKLSLQCMAYHRFNRGVKSEDILLATTAFIFRLTSNGGSSVSTLLLEQVADEVIAATETFNGCQQLRKNGICILTNERILTLSDFNRFKVAKFALGSIEGTLQNDALKILYHLSTTLSPGENSSLCTNENAKKLLLILDKKLTARTYDDPLKWLLGALIRLTLETPSSCFVIASAKGIHLISKMLQEKSTGADFKSHALILLTNISEVSSLRQEIIKSNALVKTLQDSLKTSGMRIAFITAGIVAHLSTIPNSVWTRLTGNDDLRNKLLADLHKRVLAWSTKASQLNIGYRSFSSFYSLLRRYDAPPVQLFAAWMIWNLCKMDKKYEEMLIEEQGIDVLLELRENSYADSNVRRLVKETLDGIC